MTTHYQQRFCTRFCQHTLQNKQRKKQQVEMPTGSRGAYAEVLACADLLRRGLEVYRNVSAHGRADVIARSGKESFAIEVRTGHRNARGQLCWPGSPADVCDLYAVVLAAPAEVYFCLAPRPVPSVHWQGICDWQ
jgi:hypothetical protein